MIVVLSKLSFLAKFHDVSAQAKQICVLFVLILISSFIFFFFRLLNKEKSKFFLMQNIDLQPFFFG